MRLSRKRLLTAVLAIVVVAAALIVCAYADDGGEYESFFYASFWSLVPPIIAIVLALITKEVYSSLFIGILTGALLYAGGNIELAAATMLQDGFIGSLSDSWNVGILIFLVVLGIMVVLMNRAGGSAAYGRWASGKIKSKRAALGATFGLGCLIFVDDYFNCLTVGSIMRPITDKFGISRAKLAYIIDATAAPICMIAPISSWAAAVAGVVEGDANGLTLFIKAIPYNFYSLLTIVMMIFIIAMKFDFGSMSVHERNAENGDLYTTDARPYAEISEESEKSASKGKVIDLILPVVVLVISCVFFMVYSGGIFEGESFVNAFANCDSSYALALGSFVALIITFFIYIPRRVLTFQEFMGSVPRGFVAMVPAILILTFAWTLSGMTSLLGAREYVYEVINSGAEGFKMFLPAIIFIVAVGLSFATGTSWGTFGILIPIITGVIEPDSVMLTISISACLAGAVCGDHCSPISDTTIMASTGAQSDHINHVSTQLPYAITVAAVSFVSYIITGIVQNVWIALPVAIILMLATLYVIRAITIKKKAA